MWPRDGAMTVMTLLLVGEYNISKHFFKFCNDVIEPDGYLITEHRIVDTVLGVIAVVAVIWFLKPRINNSELLK
jgi:GH15 family glucan-1,4-alpha-glucosidase